jgi:transposase
VAKPASLHLTPSQRGELQVNLRKRNLPAAIAQRIRIVLLLDEDNNYAEIGEQLRVPPSTISRWKGRYQQDGLLGLATIHPGQPPSKLTAALRARVLERTRQTPPDGSTHWSLRKMAAVVKVNKNLIARIWREAELKPHRLERYRASNDPEFEEKATAIIGLYLDPPQNAAVFCVDEKSAIQALDRLDQRLPLSPGRAEKHGFEYHRHGTLSLYAALNPQTGEVMGQTAARHTSEEFVAFLTDVVATQPAEREVHVILDNFSAHKTLLVKDFLVEHPNVNLHFTPTYSSWAESSRKLVQQTPTRCH